MNKLCFVFVCISFSLVGCNEYPKDTHHTLQQIQSRGVLRIGAIEQAPWAYRAEGGAQGIEIKLAMAFARSLGAEPQVEFLSEADATEYLRQHQIDLVVGGLTNASPRKDDVGLTRKYFQIRDEENYEHVMAVPKGENGLLVRLETFLKQQHSRIQQMWEAEGRA
ncbi:transporter substrate-binding domain-containing protein [Nitrospira sp. Ecomares 2.1]